MSTEWDGQTERRQHDDLIKQELDEIRSHVLAIHNNKQDKIKPVLWIPFVIWLASTSFGGVYAFATMNAQISYMTKIIETQALDRYRLTDAKADFAARDQRMDFLQREINDNGDEIKQLTLTVNECKKKTQNLK